MNWFESLVSSCSLDSSCLQHLSVPSVFSSVSPIRSLGMQHPPFSVNYMCEVLGPLSAACEFDTEGLVLRGSFCFDGNQDPIDSLWQSWTLDPSAGSLPWPMTLSCLPSASRLVVLKIDF